MFVRGKTFQPSLMFAGRIGTYSKGTPERSSLLRWALGLTHKLARKGLPGINTLIYWKN